MELLLYAIEEKLAHVTQERNRWLQHQADHEKAAENLRDFQKSFRKDILVPIGSKALMPGTLYHTNEVLVSMYSDLFVKCSADKALAVCKHRLNEAQKRLEALNVEYKMYKDRLDLSSDERVFGFSEEGQEIIEEYDEEREKEWRERHQIGMREQKKRETVERERLLNEAGAKDYMAILEEAELMEELEIELEQLNVDSDEMLRTHLQTDQQMSSENLTITNSFNDQDDSGDETASKEFIALSKQVADHSDSEKIKVYEERLSKITDYLDVNKESNLKGFNEFIEKQMEKGNLQDAIEELREGMNDLESSEFSIEKPKKVQSQAKQSSVPSVEKRKFNQRADYEKYETECRNQNKSTSEILIFYKSQLRSLMKTLASCTIDLTQNDDKTDLYGFICDRIDDLRFEIHKEKQIKAEEDFVDDDDIGKEKIQSELETDLGTDLVEDSVSGRRKISFASEPIVTTFDEDDEPWRVQMENNAENLNNLMDSTFQFFNSPSSSSASSICGDDEEQCANDNKNEAVLQKSNENYACTKSCGPVINASNKNCMKSSDISPLWPATLILRFSHSPNECTTVTSDSDMDSTIRNPLDIYKQFGGIDSKETAQKLPATESVQKSDTDALKDYVMNVANLDTVSICRQMRENYEKRNAMKITMEHGKLNESNASSDIPNIDVKPKKSILKNGHAVSFEIHQNTSIEDEDEEDECAQPFYSQNEPDSNQFDGFTQVLGDIVERSDRSAAMQSTPSSSNGPTAKKRVSLFKMNRMS